MKGLVMEREKIVFKFDGEFEEISVETFAKSVLGYARLVQATAEAIDAGTDIEVNIRDIRPGCVEAVLSAVASDLPGILASITQAGSGLATALSVTKEYLELRKFLGKNGAPREVRREGDQSVIVAENAKTINVTNLTVKVGASAAATKAATDMFKSLADNGNLTGVTIAAGEDADALEVPEEDFEDIVDAPACETADLKCELLEDQMLAVSRPVLEAQSGRMWRFFWRGAQISSTVADKEFFGKLERHEWSFGIGDWIKADLEVYRRLNSIGVWQIERYRVVKVHGVVSAPSEQRLF